jgi:hypothetical protein
MRLAPPSIVIDAGAPAFASAELALNPAATDVPGFA